MIRQQHADAPHPLALLRTRRERPGDCAAKRGYEFSSSDVACHVTLRLGVIHATERMLPRFDRPVCD
jgi:hypothetical protein